jgi:alpha-aminoadipic semialdehyde synthase
MSIVYFSILFQDNLPTEMPLEASQYFSDALFPIVCEIAKGNMVHPTITRATIIKEGSLVPKFKILAPILEKYGISSDQITTATKSRILLLGSGYVAKPLVDYLLRNPSNFITIASNDLKEAAGISQKRQNTATAPLNVSDVDQLGSLVDSHDIVVSFVPATFHQYILFTAVILPSNV